MKRFLIILAIFYISTQLVEARCPTVKYDTDNDRWIFPRRDVGPKYNLLGQMNVLNQHVRKMCDKFLELYKTINLKSVEISKIPLKIYNVASKAVADIYHNVIENQYFDLTEPVYNLFNITKKIADEVSNASMYSLLQYKKFGKYIKDHTDYEKLWFENAFSDLFEEIENVVEPYVTSEKMDCATYAFTAGFQIANDLYDDYTVCASDEINQNDTGINKFLLDMTDFETEIHNGLYLVAKKCVDQRLKHDPVACLEDVLTMDLGKMITKDKVKAAAKKARKSSVKRVNTCASNATKKSLEAIKDVYKQFILCFVSVKKETVTSIKGINKLALHLFEEGAPQKVCPVIKSCGESCESTVKSCKLCGA